MPLTAPMHTGAETTGTQYNLPAWYNQFARDFVRDATVLGRENVQRYKGYSTNGQWNPTVAGLSGNETQAYNMAQGGNIGGWQQGFDQASGAMHGALGQVAGATGNFDAAGANYGQAGAGLGHAAGVINNGTGMLGNATGALQNTGGALDWSMANLQPAQFMAGSGGTSLYNDAGNQAAFDAYMNPYRTEVADEIARLSNQNLFENVVPEINSTFVGDGQFGSTRNGAFMNRALRDNQSTIAGQQAQVLMSAVNEAAKNYGLEKERQLQSGQTLGALSQVGNQIGQSFTDQATGFINQANANTNIGNALTNNADSFRDLGLAQTATGNARVNQGSASGQIGANLAQLATSRNAAAMNDLNALLGTGGVERGIRQHQLDSDLALWQDYRDHPINAIGALSKILPTVTDKLNPDVLQSTAYIAQQPDVYRNLQDIMNVINGRS